MDLAEYIIMDFRGSGAARFDNYRGVPMHERGADPSAKAELSTAMLSPDEARDYQNTEGVVLVEPMDLSPISPVAQGGYTDERSFMARGTEAAWGVEAVGAAGSRFTGKGVVVAVLDTGIHATHPAFEGVTFVSKDFTGEGFAGGMNGHGTCCAAIICGRDVNGIRIGVAPGVKKLLTGKVIGQGGNTASLLNAIEWAMEERADVISISAGLDYPGKVEKLMRSGLSQHEAVSSALECYRKTMLLLDQMGQNAKARRGALLVAAAGNGSDRKRANPLRLGCDPPSFAVNTISVGAVGRSSLADTFETAVFSNCDPLLCAPGVDILSAAPGGGLQLFSGTSMAAPHVAGVAALFIEKTIELKGFNDMDLLGMRVIKHARRDLLRGAGPEDVGAGLVQAPLA